MPNCTYHPEREVLADKATTSPLCRYCCLGLTHGSSVQSAGSGSTMVVGGVNVATGQEWAGPTE